VGFLRDTARLLEEYGWYKGDFFRNWISGLIAKKTGNPESTFNDLERLKDKLGLRDIYMVGKICPPASPRFFSFEHTPRMPVADAVRISMSMTALFRRRKSLRGDVYVDGGVLDNYPVKLFDRERYIDDKLVAAHS